jgi:hypothetical protein
MIRWTRLRSGLNSAAAASVEPATATATGDLNDSTCRDISTSPASLRQKP